MAKFRKTELFIRRGNGYGQYVIHATYKGRELKVHTTNSECYDWLEDDSNKIKHKEAKRYAYSAVINASKNL